MLMLILISLTYGAVANAHTWADELVKAGETQFTSSLLPAPLGMQWRLERLISQAGEDERFAKVLPEKIGVRVLARAQRLDENAYLVRLEFTSTSERQLMLRSLATLQLPGAPAQWWNGYRNETHDPFDDDDMDLSKWFPLNAALGVSTSSGGTPISAGLGVHPRDVYSRIDSSIQNDRGRHVLTLAQPFVIDKGQSFEVSYVVVAFTSRFGYRDAVQRYYDLFPREYLPAEGIDPRINGPQTSYLAWRSNTYAFKHTDDIIRRFTNGDGGWEWCYAPFVRGGDWAITDEWSGGWENPPGRVWTPERLQDARERTASRLAQVDQSGSVPMYFVNLMYTERSLVEKHFPKIVFDRVERRCWGQNVLTSTYPGWSAYGELFLDSIDAIVATYPHIGGIAWDSLFGHRVLSPEIDGVSSSPYRSYRKGEVMSIEGAAHARLMDRSHSHSRDGLRMANVVNLKLVSPYFVHARSDAALYEGAPNERPERLERVEWMKTRLGSKGISWHKHLIPSSVRWIEWDRLAPDQIVDAMRQLHDDAILLSYFWGGYPAPNLPAMGVQRTFETMPELISLVRQGWQASPKVQAAGRVLVTRYGSGVGARIVVINPTYELQEARLLAYAEDWRQCSPIFLREDSEALVSVLSAQGAQAVINVPAKEVVTLRVAGAVEASSLSDQQPLHITSELRTDKPGVRTYSLSASTEALAPLKVYLHHVENAVETRLVQLGTTQTMTPSIENDAIFEAQLRVADWAVDYQSPNENIRLGRIYIDHVLDVALRTSVCELESLKLINIQQDDAWQPWSVVVDNNASDKVLAAAKQIVDWSVATSYSLTGQAYAPELVRQSDGVSGNRSVYIHVVKEADIAPHMAKVELKDGTLVIAGQDENSIANAIVGLLRIMDTVYPYYGKLPSKDPYLKACGLAGNVLERKPPVHVTGPTLEEWLIRSRLMDSKK